MYAKVAGTTKLIKAVKSSECYLQTQANRTVYPLQSTRQNRKIRGQADRHVLKTVLLPTQSMRYENALPSQNKKKNDRRKLLLLLFDLC